MLQRKSNKQHHVENKNFNKTTIVLSSTIHITKKQSALQHDCRYVSRQVKGVQLKLLYLKLLGHKNNGAAPKRLSLNNRRQNVSAKMMQSHATL